MFYTLFTLLPTFLPKLLHILRNHSYFFAYSFIFSSSSICCSTDRELSAIALAVAPANRSHIDLLPIIKPKENIAMAITIKINNKIAVFIVLNLLNSCLLIFPFPLEGDRGRLLGFFKKRADLHRQALEEKELSL